MTKFRISIAATLIVASLICTVLARKGLTKAQNAALRVCQDNFYSTYNNCMALNFQGVDCEDVALGEYKTCLRKAGIPFRVETPVPRPSVGPVKTPTPKPTPPRVPVGPITQGSPIGHGPTPPLVPGKQGNPTPTPTPITIFAKPKATPTPTPKPTSRKKGHG